MAKLFGLDIAKIVSDSIAGAGGVRPGVLTVKTTGTRTPGSLTAGTQPTTTTYTFKGFAENRTQRRFGTSLSEQMSIVTILGASVQSLYVPKVDDIAVIDGQSYMLKELMARDPASAVYEFRTE